MSQAPCCLADSLTARYKNLKAAFCNLPSPKEFGDVSTKVCRFVCCITREQSHLAWTLFYRVQVPLTDSCCAILCHGR